MSQKATLTRYFSSYNLAANRRRLSRFDWEHLKMVPKLQDIGRSKTGPNYLIGKDLEESNENWDDGPAKGNGSTGH